MLATETGGPKQARLIPIFLHVEQEQAKIHQLMRMMLAGPRLMPLMLASGASSSGPKLRQLMLMMLAGLS